MTLSDLWPTFQGHDNSQRPITHLTVSRVWSVQWFCFQWPWVTSNVDFKVTEMPSTNCVRSWRAICLRQLSSSFERFNTYTWGLWSLQNTEKEANSLLPLGIQKLKGFQLQGGYALLTPWRGALPLDPAGGSVPRPRYRLALRARHLSTSPFLTWWRPWT